MKWVYVIYRCEFNAYESDSRTEVFKTMLPAIAISKLQEVTYNSFNEHGMYDYILTAEVEVSNG